MILLNVFQWNDLLKERLVGTVTIDGSKLSVATEDAELARAVREVNDLGFVYRWEPVIDEDALGDRLDELLIAETDEFVEWFRRQLLGWQFIVRVPQE